MADVPVAPVSGASPVYDRPCGADAQPRAAGRAATARPCSRTARRCCGSWARPISRASAGSGSSTTTWSWATRCSGRAATPPWSACTAPAAGLALTTDCTPRYCFADPAHGRAAGGGRGLAQPGGRRRPAAGDHQLPQLRQSRAAARHGPARRLHRGHGRGLPGARLPGRVRQRLALQRDRRQRDPAHAQCRRPRRDRPISGAWSASPGLRSEGLALVLLGECLGWLGCSLYWCQLVEAATTAPRRRSTSPPSAAPASSCWRRSPPGWSAACHDLSDGGLAVAVAEMCLAGRHRCRRSSLPAMPAALRLVVRRGSGPLPAGRRAPGPAVAPGRGRRRPACSPREVGRTGGDALILARRAAHIDG